MTGHTTTTLHDMMKGLHDKHCQRCDVAPSLLAQRNALLEALERIAGAQFTPQAGHNVFNLDGKLSEVQDIARQAIQKGEA